MDRTVQITVLGKPSQQGSKKHVGHGVMVEMAKGLPAWRKLVVKSAIEQRSEDHVVLDGALRLFIDFYMPRPASVPRTVRERPIVSPDLDKMVRAVCDALTIAGVWVDDRLVVSLRIEEYYDDVHPAGCEIVVVEI